MKQMSLNLSLIEQVKAFYPKINESMATELAELLELQDAGFSEELYNFLFDFYCNNGEMPYGVAKARTGDPYEWLASRVELDFGV